VNIGILKLQLRRILNMLPISMNLDYSLNFIYL
jgi:hypothetical protein